MISQIYTAKSEYVSIPRGQVSYLRLGEGLPLVMIQGFGNHYQDWGPIFVEELSKNFTLYLVNNRGVGHSYSKSNENNMKGIANDIVEFIKTLRLSHKPIILGHSMGGYLAQEVALALRDQIAGLILMSTRMGGRFRTMADADTLSDITKHYPTRLEETETILKYLAPPEFHEKMREHFRRLEGLTDSSDIQIPIEMRDVCNTARIKWLEEFENQHLQYREFRFLTLILTGNDDRIIPAQNSIEMAREIPNSWLVRFPNGGHDLYHQFPDHLSRRIFDAFKSE